MQLNKTKVVQFLKEKQKTQEWLACELSCSMRTIQYMCLEGKVPSVETLFDLSRLIGCAPEDLIVYKKTRAGKLL